MASTISIFCTLALFVQTITCQCIGNALNSGLNFNGLPFGANYANGLTGNGLAGSGLAASGYGAAGAGGRGFTVTSSSPIAPTGLSVIAENLAIEGPLSVGGQLPFLGTIGLEGTLPAVGSGAVSYGCGSAGNVGIISEGLGGPGLPGPYGLAGQAYGPGLAGPAYGNGLVNGYGPGLAGAGLVGPGLAGPGIAAGGLVGGFGQGLAGPGLGNGLIGPGFGAGLAGMGLGYNGVNAALK